MLVRRHDAWKQGSRIQVKGVEVTTREPSNIENLELYFRIILNMSFNSLTVICPGAASCPLDQAA